MQSKIKSFQELKEILQKLKQQKQKIVQCHGVFDLLHLGHIRHLKEAKKLGDKLIVSVTPDRYVNKGPGRPAFKENLRLETLAAIGVVDYVVLNDAPDAISAIKKIQPKVYVKGVEYKNHKKDVTGKISRETAAVENHGGEIYYSDDIVFSSSSLINKYLMPSSPEVERFIQQVKAQYSLEQLIEKIENLADLKVVIVGDAILDEYQYVELLGQSGKGLHMVAALRDKELFLGGSLILANHIAQFVKEVVLITALGEKCPHLNFIREKLDKKVILQPIYIKDKPTLVKKRYVLQDGKSLTKLFEVYSFNDFHLNSDKLNLALQEIKKAASNAQMLLVSDFGNGFTNNGLIQGLAKIPIFMALNTQINSGNRGYNVVTQYKKADYISLNEPEVRFAAHDRYAPLDEVVATICQKMKCQSFSVTRGINGVFCLEQGKSALQIPAFVSEVVDRVGAGDSYLALSSLCKAKGYPMIVSGFIGSLAAALEVQIVGNKEAVKKDALVKFLTRLMK